MRTVFAVLLIVGLAGVPVGVQAAENNVAAAKRHFKSGRELYAQARYEAAIVEFDAAYRAKPHGVIYFNLAQCYEKLGDVTNAVKNYRDYLRNVPQAEDRKTVETVVANLEQRIKEAELQALTLNSQPPGASVALDGEPKGVTPFSERVKAGWHNVSLELEGYQKVSKLVNTLPDQPTTLDIPLTMSARPSMPVATSSNTARESKALRSNKGMWISFGLAGILAGAGALTGLSASSKAAELRSVENGTQQQVQSLHDSSRRRARNANILYGTSGAALLAGVAFFVFETKF